MTEIGFPSMCSTRASRLRRSASVCTRDGMPGMIQSGAMPFAVFANCPSSELRVGCCQYSRRYILALSATYFGSFARLSLVRSRTPMIWCLSNARSGDLQFGTSFVALRALVREIIANTIPTHIHTYMTQVGFPSIVWLRLRTFGAQPPSE